MLKYLPIFLLPFSCIGVSSVFTAISLIIYIYCLNKKNTYNNIDLILKNKLIVFCIFMMMLWVLSMVVASILNGEYSGIFECKHYVERMLYFILAILFFTKNKQYYISFIFGLLGAVLILDVNTIFNFLYYNQWRPETLLGNPNKLGGFLILVIPFVSIGLVMFREKKLYRFFVLFVLVMTGIALFLSGSRGAWIGIIGSFFVVIFIRMLNGKDGLKRKKILSYIAYGIVSSVIIIGLFYVIDPNFVFHSSDMERLYLWNSAINIIKDYPIYGIGFGNFNEVYNNGYILEYAKNPHLTSPHNIFLHYAVNFGLLGGLTFVFLIFSQIYILLNNIQYVYGYRRQFMYAALCGIIGMVVHGMVDTLITVRPYASMYWMLYGVTCCCLNKNCK